MAYDEKSKERVMRHLKKLKEIRFRVKNEEYEKYEEAARRGGYESMRQFYLDAINQRTEQIFENAE